MSGRRIENRYAISAALGSLAIATLLVLEFLQLPGDSILSREIQDAGHVVLHGCGAIVAFLVINRFKPADNKRSWQNYALAFMFMAMLGALSEALQVLTPRDANAEDFARDLAGAFGFLVLLALGIDWSSKPLPTRLGLAILGFSVLTLAIFSLFSWSAAYLERERQFPVLLDFVPGWHASFAVTSEAQMRLDPPPPDFTDASSSYVARIRFGPGTWPGLSHPEPVRDWSAYRKLSFRVFNPDTETRLLTIRIEDRQHNGDYDDRFNRPFPVLPGSNAIAIQLSEIADAPTGRTLDLSNVASFSIFSDHIEQPFVLYMDKIILE